MPYRDAKLTRLLQDSLSGGGSVALVVTLRSEAPYVDETIGTLRFAQRAKAIPVRLHRIPAAADGTEALRVLLRSTQVCMHSHRNHTAIASQSHRDHTAITPRSHRDHIAITPMLRYTQEELAHARRAVERLQRQIEEQAVGGGGTSERGSCSLPPLTPLARQNRNLRISLAIQRLVS